MRKFKRSISAGDQNTQLGWLDSVVFVESENEKLERDKIDRDRSRGSLLEVGMPVIITITEILL